MFKNSTNPSRVYMEQNVQTSKCNLHSAAKVLVYNLQLDRFSLLRISFLLHRSAHVLICLPVCQYGLLSRSTELGGRSLASPVEQNREVIAAGITAGLLGSHHCTCSVFSYQYQPRSSRLVLELRSTTPYTDNNPAQELRLLQSLAKSDLRQRRNGSMFCISLQVLYRGSLHYFRKGQAHSNVLSMRLCSAIGHYTCRENVICDLRVLSSLLDDQPILFLN